MEPELPGTDQRPLKEPVSPSSHGPGATLDNAQSGEHWGRVQAGLSRAAPSRRAGLFSISFGSRRQAWVRDRAAARAVSSQGTRSCPLAALWPLRPDGSECPASSPSSQKPRECPADSVQTRRVLEKQSGQGSLCIYLHILLGDQGFSP